MQNLLPAPMRTPRLLLAGLALAAQAASAAGGAPITAVTLYPGSASVVRSARVESGATELTVDGLSAAFSTQNLRVDADAGIRIGQIETRDESLVHSANPAQADLEHRIQDLQDQEAALDAESRAAALVKGYLEHLGGDPASATDRARTPQDAKALAGVIETIGHAANDALARIQRLGVQKRELGRKIAALQSDLAQMRGDGSKRRTLVIHLAAARSGAVRIAYTVDSAGWRPGYRAELDSATSRLRLVRLAQVAQKTGESWAGVRMVLSTSQPNGSPEAPDPSPWLLTYTPPQPAQAKRMLSLERMAVAQDMAVPAPMAPPPPADAAGYTPPTFETDGVFATQFEVSSPVNLPADGRELSLELSAQELPVSQRVQVTPRIDTAATVTALAERPAGAWVPGSMQLYRDGNYVGEFAWNPQAAEKFTLPFGRDDLVRVTLDHVKGDQGTTGVFDRRNERRIADVMTVKSSHATPIDVLLLETSPVSTSDEIKVTASFDPAPSINPWEQRRGVVAWERTLKPEESARFAVTYAIEYPKEGFVSGLGN